MNKILDIYAQILNLKWQLNGMIINEGIKIIDSINEYKRFEAQYEFDKKRNDFHYEQIKNIMRNKKKNG